METQVVWMCGQQQRKKVDPSNFFSFQNIIRKVKKKKKQRVRGREQSGETKRNVEKNWSELSAINTTRLIEIVYALLFRFGFDSLLFFFDFGFDAFWLWNFTIRCCIFFPFYSNNSKFFETPPNGFSCECLLDSLTHVTKKVSHTHTYEKKEWWLIFCKSVFISSS